MVFRKGQGNDRRRLQPEVNPIPDGSSRRDAQFGNRFCPQAAILVGRKRPQSSRRKTFHGPISNSDKIVQCGVSEKPNPGNFYPLRKRVSPSFDDYLQPVVENSHATTKLRKICRNSLLTLFIAISPCSAKYIKRTMNPVRVNFRLF